MRIHLPSGTVTFLFSDIEGSTRLWEMHPKGMKAAVERHDAILRQSIEANQGFVIKTTGDGFHAVFETALDAAMASLGAQLALENDAWNEIQPNALRARVALYSGEASQRSGDYYGTSVNRAARLMSIGHGGQILLSNSTAELLRDGLPEGVSLVNLGEHRLKDLVRPEQVYQLSHLSLPAEFPPLKSLDVFPNNLPMQLTSYIGREHEMEEVKRLLSTTRLLTLTGSGGTGKTRLALQVAADLLPAFPNGVWLVEFASIFDPDLVVETIAAIFDLRKVTGSPPLLELVTNYLRAKKLLLILDNCEHLIEACAFLADHLLRFCPQLTMIASNREAFGIQGETIYRVPSLSLPDSSQMSVDQLMRYESVQLFVERAMAAQPRFILTNQNAAAVARICQRLDGIPLAIELAAARIRVITPEQIASRLDDRFRLLTGGSRTALPRQQTLRALIDWSYDLLPETEQALLRRLSVFSGGWTYEAAESVCPDLDVLDTLDRLVNKSLVFVIEHGGEARYGLLETIRQYARDKLMESGESVAARDRHLDYYLQVAGPTVDRLFSDSGLQWANLLDLEYENIRTAFEWGLDRRPEHSLRLVGDLFLYLTMRGNLNEAVRWAEDALARVKALPPTAEQAADERARLVALGLVALGQFHLSLGETIPAHAAFEEAITLARTLSNERLLMVALGLYSTASMFLNDISATHAAAQESVELSRKTGDQWMISWSLGTLSWAEGALGHKEKRAALAGEAKLLLDQKNDPIKYNAVMMLGLEARAQGEWETAHLYLEESLKFIPLFNSKPFTAMVRSEVAHLSRQEGDYRAAKEAYQKTILLWVDLGHRAAIAHQLECLAFIARVEQQFERAARLFGAAEALREMVESLMTDYERPEYEREVALLRGQMAPDALASAWQEGRRMTTDQAVEYAQVMDC